MTDALSELEGLQSSSSHVRLKAARALARQQLTSREMAQVRDAYRRETVGFVRRALQIILEHKQQLPADPSPAIAADDEPLASLKREQYVRAMKDVTGLMIHEFSPIVAPLRLEAESIRPPATELLHHVDRLGQMMETIDALRRAVSTPHPIQFDLHTTVEQVIVLVGASAVPLEVKVEGPRDLSVHGDEALIRLALLNGLRNAIEALQSDNARPELAKRVVVSFGATDVEAYISVIDNGPGLIGLYESAFAPGRTTKGGSHAGLGLHIARLALEVQGGSARLSPARGGGAVFELRWFLEQPQ